MKRIFTLFVVSIACCISCSQKEDIISGTELYAEMVDYSEHLVSIVKDIEGINTKSYYSDLDVFDEIKIDINTIDDKYIDYINLYTEPTFIQNWDERSILDLIARDSNFSNDEKINFAKCLSAAYFVKTNYGFGLTKSGTSLEDALDDCYKDYCAKCKRNDIDFMLLLLAAIIIEPSFSGEIFAYINFARAMTQAEQDYVTCLERARRDHPLDGYTADGTPEN